MDESSEYLKKVASALRELGLPTYTREHRYLRTALLIAFSDPDSIYYVTKNLYPNLAAIHHVTPFSAEHTLKKAVDRVWYETDIEALRKLFGPSVTRMQEPPTTAQFIATLCETLRYLA